MYRTRKRRRDLHDRRKLFVHFVQQPSNESILQVYNHQVQHVESAKKKNE